MIPNVIARLLDEEVSLTAYEETITALAKISISRSRNEHKTKFEAKRQPGKEPFYSYNCRKPGYISRNCRLPQNKGRAQGGRNKEPRKNERDNLDAT